MKKCTLLLAAALFVCTATRVHAQCSVNAGSDVTLYAGYPPQSCATLTATPSGTAPFSYLWSNGSTSASITVCDLASTVYTVTVTDASGCISTDQLNVTVVDVRCGKGGRKILVCHAPPGNPSNSHTICISANAVAAHLAHGDHLGDCNVTPPTPCSVNLGNDTAFCGGSSLVLNAGTGFATYVWSDSSTSQTLSVTTSGTYWVRATTSGGCIANDTIHIQVHNPPTISLLADSLPDSLGCRNIVATVSPGTPPYTLLWSNGDTGLAIHVCDTNTVTYTVTVTDSSGCSASASVTITPPTPACAVNLGNDTSQCFGGTFLLDAGPGFTSYLWSDSSTAQTLSVTQSGTYWVTASDSASGCTATDSISLTLFPSPVLSLSADSLPDSLGCRNITVLVTSGSLPITYAWSTGDTTVSIHVCDTVMTTYIVTVTDSNGCSATDSIVLNPPCLVDLGPDTAVCTGTSYVLDAGPGFTSYLWSDSSTAQTLSITQSGSYWVQVSDPANACTASDTVNITLHAVPVISFQLDSLLDSLGCRDLMVIVTGGTTPYAILWNTGDTTATLSVCDTLNTWYYVTVTDSNGCPVTDSILVTKVFTCQVNLGNDTSLCAGDTLLLDAGLGFVTYLWSDSSTAQTLSVTQSGTYWVQVSDTAIACQTSDTIVVTVHAPVAVNLVADSLPDSLGCRNITALVTVGTPPFIYSWSTGDSTAGIHVCDTATTTYVLATTDANGCSAIDSITLVPVLICNVDLGPDTSLCVSGPYVLDAGAGFQHYLWSDSSTAQTLSVTQSGTYWVEVSDSASGCLTRDSLALVIFDAPVATLVADTVADSLGCFNIVATVIGGTPPYTYVWSNGDTTLAINVCDTVPTQYIFMVTDSNGCMSMDTAMVNDTASRPVARIGRITLNMYPNPVLDNARIDFSVPHDGRVVVELFDIQGTLLRVLYTGYAKESTLYSVAFSGTNLIEGVYMVRLSRENGGTVNKKFILFKY